SVNEYLNWMNPPFISVNECLNWINPPFILVNQELSVGLSCGKQATFLNPTYTPVQTTLPLPYAQYCPKQTILRYIKLCILSLISFNNSFKTGARRF
ncbi:MAG: hypothetical protein RMX97_21250, partial [Nostoc sp. DedQUE11]|nr:hypothetical protein [Nostoc sp. DedQUE11]